MQEKSYQKDPNIVSREIDDEVILVPIKKKLADVNAIYLLQDDVSCRIWALIDGKRSVRPGRPRRPTGETHCRICRSTGGNSGGIRDRWAARQECRAYRGGPWVWERGTQS